MKGTGHVQDTCPCSHVWFGRHSVLFKTLEFFSRDLWGEWPCSPQGGPNLGTRPRSLAMCHYHVRLNERRFNVQSGHSYPTPPISPPRFHRQRPIPRPQLRPKNIKIDPLQLLQTQPRRHRRHKHPKCPLHIPQTVTPRRHSLPHILMTLIPFMPKRMPHIPSP